jgi:hypothetical protein
MTEPLKEVPFRTDPNVTPMVSGKPSLKAAIGEIPLYRSSPFPDISDL